jgi:hypothetical protein
MSHEFDGLDATEKAGIGAALNRCRALAAQIASKLHNRGPSTSLTCELKRHYHAEVDHDVGSPSNPESASAASIPPIYRPSYWALYKRLYAGHTVGTLPWSPCK